MSEYMKKKQPVQPSQAKKAEAVDPRREMTNGIPNSVLQDIFAGKRKADASMMGHSDTLAPSIAAKMSRAFGMDLSGVQVSRSDKMKGTGMQGMAQGNKVVLSSDVDLNTMEGQVVLGHELSHIRAQSQGIGMGNSGLYQNASLEHQADVEGMRAARGLFASHEGGMEMGMGMSYGLGMKGLEGLTPLSGGMSASAGAPMQAKKPDSEKEANQMMYDYAQQRAGKLDLKGKSSDQLMGIWTNEDAALKKYAKSVGMPKKDLDDIKKYAKNWYQTDKAAQKKYIQKKKDAYYENLIKAATGGLAVYQYSGLAEKFDKDKNLRIENNNNLLDKNFTEEYGKYDPDKNGDPNGKRAAAWHAKEKAKQDYSYSEINNGNIFKPENPYAALLNAGISTSNGGAPQQVVQQQAAQEQAGPIKKESKGGIWAWFKKLFS